MHPAEVSSGTVAAVITAYKPAPGMLDRFACLLEQCQWVVISDNTPGGCSNLQPAPGFQVLRHGRNLGLGAALNAGVRWAQGEGATRILLLDQDSQPDAKLVKEMLHELDRLISMCGPRICVGPKHIEPDITSHHPDSIQLESRMKQQHRLRERTCLPTSGMLIAVGDGSPIDDFSKDFFIDLVDHEWCWRLRTQGWRFFCLQHLLMPHRLGLGARRFLGVPFFDQQPYRHYFQVRDTLRLLGLRHVPLYALVKLTVFMLIKSVALPVILDRGLERSKWILLGFRDACMGRTGIGAAATVLDR